MDRIVSVTTVDLITLYGTIMKLANVTVIGVDAATTNGEFEIESASGNLLATEPVKKLTFGSSVTSATVYFVAAYDYEGFFKGEDALTTTGDIEPDGRTLYKAVLGSGSVTITKAGF